jgi:hypothetical protein
MAFSDDNASSTRPRLRLICSVAGAVSSARACPRASSCKSSMLKVFPSMATTAERDNFSVCPELMNIFFTYGMKELYLMVYLKKYQERAVYENKSIWMPVCEFFLGCSL